MGIKFEKVNHFYEGIHKNDNFVAIQDINLEIAPENEFIAICGKTGSGKSTLIQHMNALLFPTGGKVTIFGKEILPKKNKELNKVRKRVGLVFQFPEYQLFEETVLKDVMFGPKNVGFSLEEAKEKAMEALKLVGLEEAIYEKSPFNLSGGQMRKVAIASILAMNPDILVLDEPTRGLDPQGQKETMDLFHHLHQEFKKSIVLVTHDMNLIHRYGKRVIVMKDSKIVFEGKVIDLLQNPNLMQYSLRKPDIIVLIDALNSRMQLNLSYEITTIDELLLEIKKEVKACQTL